MTATTEYCADDKVHPSFRRPHPSKRGWINCFYRTYKGKRLGPYYVRRWKFNGKVHKQYIKPKDVERVRAECQTYRERSKAISRYVNNVTANLNYMVKMVKWSEQGKIRHCDLAFMNRLEKEGWDIDGRPKTRRHISRQIQTIDGIDMIVTTVYELDGTTKSSYQKLFRFQGFCHPERGPEPTRDFMVPLLVKNPIDYLKEIFDRAFERAFSNKKRPCRPRKHQNLWLQSPR